MRALYFNICKPVVKDHTCVYLLLYNECQRERQRAREIEPKFIGYKSFFFRNIMFEVLVLAFVGIRLTFQMSVVIMSQKSQELEVIVANIFSFTLI